MPSPEGPSVPHLLSVGMHYSPLVSVCSNARMQEYCSAGKLMQALMCRVFIGFYYTRVLTWVMWRQLGSTWESTLSSFHLSWSKPPLPPVSWWQVPSFWLGQHVSAVISLGQMMSESIVFTLLHYLITMSSQVWSRGLTTNSKNITREIPTKWQVPPVGRDREASCTLCYTETAQTLEQNTFPQSMGFHAESSPKLRRLPNHRPNF